jgi:hypothetical protein
MGYELWDINGKCPGIVMYRDVSCRVVHMYEHAVCSGDVDAKVVESLPFVTASPTAGGCRVYCKL